MRVTEIFALGGGCDYGDYHHYNGHHKGYGHGHYSKGYYYGSYRHGHYKYYRHGLLGLIYL